jgi:hypothetical protein
MTIKPEALRQLGRDVCDLLVKAEPELQAATIIFHYPVDAGHTAQMVVSMNRGDFHPLDFWKAVATTAAENLLALSPPGTDYVPLKTGVKTKEPGDGGAVH